MQSSSIRYTLTSNKLLLVAAISFITLCIIYIRQISPERNSVLIQDTSQTRSWLGHNIMWKGEATPQRWVDMHLRPLPSDLQDATTKRNSRLKQSQGYVNVLGDYSVYFREVTLEKSKPVAGVLFLHGDGFTSQRWIEMGTMHLVGSMGFRAVAVDLPGFGNTRSLVPPTSSEKEEFMRNLLDVLHLNTAILVSQSESCNYSLPIVIGQPQILAGFIAISPTNVKSYNVTHMQQNQIATLLIYDGSITETNLTSSPSWSLRNLPNSRAFLLDAANNASSDGGLSYKNKQDFHWLLYNFLIGVLGTDKTPILPVMVFCAENDRLQIGQGSRYHLALLNSLPNSRLISMLVDGNQPLIMVNELQRFEFHRLLYNYLSNLFKR